MRRFALPAAVLLAAGLVAPLAAPLGHDGSSAPGALPPPALRFLAWGDSGHGNDVQRAVAAAAARVCEREGCDFVLLLGDNVYPDGISSPLDPQFDEKFTRPHAPVRLPFFAVLGNHDAAVPSEDGDNGDHMVARSWLPTDADARLVMPDRWYSFGRAGAAFYALDLTEAARSDAPGLGERERAQAEWLERDMEARAARWNVAFSHFPYVSDGRHGDAGSYGGREGAGMGVRAFVQEAVCGRADLYLSAHDHVLEWLPAPDDCPGTEMVVSGAASEPRPLVGNASRALFARGDTPGFFWFEVQGDRLTGRAYGTDGAVLYERTLVKDAEGVRSVTPP